MKKFVNITALMISFLGGQMLESKHFELQRLADGVYVAIPKVGGHAICNAGIIDLGDKTLIFDTFMSPIAAQDLLAAVEEMKLSPVAYVINSHHHNDHIRGNQVYSDDAKIISTGKTKDLIEKREPGQIEQEKQYAKEAYSQAKTAMEAEKNAKKKESHLMWCGYYEALIGSHPILKTRLPDTTFEQECVLDGPKRKAQLLCYGGGHTESDAILILPDDKIAFMGDLVFIEVHAFMADGNPEHWKAYLTRVQEVDFETVVPGHGPVGTKEALSTMLQYITMTETLAQKMIDEGKGETAIEELVIPAPFDSYWFDNFFRANMKFMYNRVKETKH